MSQTGRVLALLRARGTNGVTVPDFDPPNGRDVADGGPRITRLAARIRDLRDQGHTITKTGETAQGFARYVLTSVAPAEQADVVPGWFRERQCYHRMDGGLTCMAHLHGPLGDTCPRGHDTVLAWVFSPERCPNASTPHTTTRRAA